MESINWTQEQMLEVTLKEPDDFLKIRETLSRIGVASRKEKKIYRSKKKMIGHWKPNTTSVRNKRTNFGKF